MDRQTTDFSLHVLRVLVRVRRTSKMTVCSPPALVASRTSFSLLGLIGIGRWHRSRVPRVLPEHHTPNTVRGVSTHGLLRCRCASLGTSRGYHTFRFDVDHRLTPCRHVRSAGSCLFAIIRRPPRRLCRRGKEARQHPREGAWFMHGWASLIRCDPVRSAPMTYEHNRAPAAFRSST